MWKLAEQVAKFEYKRDPSSPYSWSLSVSSVNSDNSSPKPFFSVSIQPIPLVTRFIGIPINTKTLPGNVFTLTQPPLPKGPLPEEIEAGVETIEERESRKPKYARLSPDSKGTIFFVKMTPGLDNGEIGDGVMFPAVKPWTVAGAVEGFDLSFPVSEWVEL
ncbi:hypothetical protein V5O48_004795 [Marasmius crinis-equi]|uniref:Uncharacterized protein n=1 Tax=Marasmius crinis-equi TaxID=585013 RepID=A0ABR3FP31_9AGAR